MAYQPNIPTGTVDLDVDYKNLQDNFQALDAYFGIDHVPYSIATPQSGYHKTAHLIPEAVDPVAVSGIGEVYCKTTTDGFSTDEQLFYQSGSGLISALTRNFQPLAASNGYTFLPGGLVIQWGIKTAVGGQTTTVNFITSNKDFINNCFTVQLCAISTILIGLQLNAAPSITGFVARHVTGYTGNFFWVAIGN